MDVRVFFFLALLTATSLASSHKKTTKKALRKYPKDSEFWVTDFFVHGCENYLTNCPRAYKNQMLCARDYDGNYKDFANFCEMQYENCNTWNKWKIFKRARC